MVADVADRSNPPEFAIIRLHPPVKIIKMAINPITIMEITKKFDISYQTANYYVNLGFFNVIDTKGNKRIFDEKEVAYKLEKIRTMRARGYPLRLIREHLG